MRKVLITLAAVLAAVALTAGILTISYANSDDCNSSVFTEGTVINGVNCSGLTYKEAAMELTDEWNSRHLQVVGDLGETLADYTDFGLIYDLNDQLATLKKDNLIQSAINHYLHTPINASIAMKVKTCREDFAKEVKSSDFLHRDGVIETQDAYVDLENPDFPIVPEVYGTKADPEAFLDDLLHAIEMGQTRFVYDEKSYTSRPKVKSEDPELVKYQQFCQKYLNQKITYEFGKDSYTLSAEDLDSIMDDNLSGKADPEKVGIFVEKLKKEYDLEGGEVTFKSLTGKTFKVARGDFIWVIDAEGEAGQLMEDVASHKDVKREPVYATTGSGEYSRELHIGKTYVDVDITKQHVIYFKKGKKAFECDCVTGCVAYGHDTPTGVYELNNKARNITLIGPGKKGDPGYYESFVSYWMSFIGNSIGLHDASWRSEAEFGGSTYKYDGSHGCVNLPPSKTGKLYEILEIGTPVIVHN